MSEQINIIKRSLKKHGIFFSLDSPILGFTQAKNLFIKDTNIVESKNYNDAIVFTIGNNDFGKPDIIFLCGPGLLHTTTPDILMKYVRDIFETCAFIGMSNFVINAGHECMSRYGRIYSECTMFYKNSIPQNVFNQLYDYYDKEFEYIVMIPIGYEM